MRKVKVVAGVRDEEREVVAGVRGEGWGRGWMDVGDLTFGENIASLSGRIL
jgi:hypothetical protein